MNRKDKKRLTVLVERLANRRQQLAAAIQQPDEPLEVAELQREIEALEGQVRGLRDAKPS